MFTLDMTCPPLNEAFACGLMGWRGTLCAVLVMALAKERKRAFRDMCISPVFVMEALAFCF